MVPRSMFVQKVVPASIPPFEFELSGEIQMSIRLRGALSLPWSLHANSDEEGEWLLSDNFERIYLGGMVWEVCTQQSSLNTRKLLEKDGIPSAVSVSNRYS